MELQEDLESLKGNLQWNLNEVCGRVHSLILLLNTFTASSPSLKWIPAHYVHEVYIHTLTLTHGGGGGGGAETQPWFGFK